MAVAARILRMERLRPDNLAAGLLADRSAAVAVVAVEVVVEWAELLPRMSRVDNSAEADARYERRRRCKIERPDSTLLRIEDSS
jgi:hypothetical protein